MIPKYDIRVPLTYGQALYLIKQAENEIYLYKLKGETNRD